MMSKTKQNRVTWEIEGSANHGWLKSSFIHPRQKFSTGAIWELHIITEPTEGAQFTSEQLLEKLVNDAEHFDPVADALAEVLAASAETYRTVGGDRDASDAAINRLVAAERNARATLRKARGE